MALALRVSGEEADSSGERDRSDRPTARALWQACLEAT